MTASAAIHTLCLINDDRHGLWPHDDDARYRIKVEMQMFFAIQMAKSY